MPDAVTLTDADLDALAVGTWILGTGGGGDPYFGYLCAKKLYREGRRVRLIDPSALDDAEWVACVNQMGAPLPAEERLTDPRVMVKAVRMMEEQQRIRFTAVMPWEIGGGNGFQPVLVAALLDLPVVDADAMGRAFPEASMTSFAVADLAPYPLVMADIRDNAIVYTRAASWQWLERMRRQTCTVLGALAATCNPPRTGAEVKVGSHLHTVSKALALGRAVREARRAHRDPIQAVLDLEGGRRLFRGKVVDINRRTTGGFLRGTVRVAGLDGDRDHELAIDFQNEFSVAFLDGRPRVTVPELICVMDSFSGDAIGTETVRYGQRVTVIALPAPPMLLTDRGLELTGPRAFGYDLDFHSVFAEGGA
jgi:DUF917 family protein